MCLGPNYTPTSESFPPALREDASVQAAKWHS
jgi:hypothetical protein